MNLETYKLLLKNLASKHPRLRNGEYSVPYVNDLAKCFKMTIDANAFVLFTNDNKEFLEAFGKRLDVRSAITNNLSTAQNACKDLPIEAIVSQKTFTKTDWALMIYIVFADPTLSSTFISSLSERQQAIWKAMVWSKELMSSQVEDIIGESPLLNLGKLNNYSQKETVEVLTHYSPFATEHSEYSRTSTFTFSLPATIRYLQKPFVEAPKDSKFHAITELPQGISIFESETLALQDISRILAYHSQGNIKVSTSGKPNASSVNKMRKSLSISEFYSDDKEIENLRSLCLANWILYVNLKKVSVGTPQIEILNGLFDLFAKNKADTLPMLLPHLKGVHKLEEYYDTNKTKLLYDIFNTLESKEWYTAKNLENVLIYQEYDYIPGNKHGVSSYVYYTLKDERYSENVYVSGSNYEKMFVDAYMKGTIFLLASLGIFDLAYTKPDTEEFGETFYSEWEGLYAFRITPLGAYLLGKTKEYEAPVNEDSTELFFDENELIILGKSDDKLTDTLLQNYVQKAGASRYIVTSQSFLKDCKTPKQIKDKIALFKQTVGKSKLPDNWEAFFDLLQERSNNVVKTEDFQVFQLNASDKELIRLIAQEKSFQNIVFKAEGYKILVANDKVTSFRSKLKDWGYLLK